MNDGEKTQVTLRKNRLDTSHRKLAQRSRSVLEIVIHPVWPGSRQVLMPNV